jgi:DNA damage-binding protein 2
MTCPHHISPGHGCSVSSDIATGNHIISLPRDRENKGQAHAVPLTSKDWQLESAVLKLRSRRSTCLEFHPLHNALVFSGDKKGEIAV